MKKLLILLLTTTSYKIEIAQVYGVPINRNLFPEMKCLT